MGNSNIISSLQQIQIPCPCGSRCRGTDRFGSAPICFLSYNGNTMPSNFLKKRYSAKSFLGGIVQGIILAYIERAVEPTFFVYQCPVCGCEVLFETVSSNDGITTKRVADQAKC